MIINGKSLLEIAPIENMLSHKIQANPTSYGLTECGYDIRLKQRVHFVNGVVSSYDPNEHHPDFVPKLDVGNFVLGSSIERFQMPSHLMGRVLNKSTWARKGLDASMTTNIEPGWSGNLTIELVYHGSGELVIPAGAGICQIIFERILNTAQYEGKYQNQEDRPVDAIIGAA